MKLSEFSKPAPPVSPSACQEPGPASTEAPQEEQYITATTPSGIEIQYAWAPRRLYRLRPPTRIKDSDDPWSEVPSVTTVLGVLDKSGPLTWWGMKVGVEGMLELGKLAQAGKIPSSGGYERSVDEIVALLTEHKLTVNHVKDKAADRGVNVHGALEAWVADDEVPQPQLWPDHERGYIEGLADFMLAIGDPADVQSELMVGSLQHQYAGRFDLVLTLSKPVDVVTRLYPKRKPRVEEIPAGRYLIDLKTRAKPNVYPTNLMQLEAYEAAAVECGYQPTDYRAALIVTPEGGYQFSVNTDYCFQDFLAVRACYQVLNEREVLRVLREELDAKEVA